MPVELVTTPTAEIHAALNALIPQLSRSAPPLTWEQFESFVAQPDVHFFVFRGEGEGAPVPQAPVLGMASLATFAIPTGLRGWVEDVVVDKAARGQGAGQQLVEAMLDKARELGLATVDLTSRPSREEANRLYVRCGFVPRETNIYRYSV